MRLETERLLYVIRTMPGDAEFEPALDAYIAERMKSPELLDKLADAMCERIATEVPFFDSIGTTYECRIVRKETNP